MHAKSLHFPYGSNPEALIQIAQHLTPELVLQPRCMKHRNGAKSITEIIVCTEDPIGYVKKYKKYTGHESKQKENLNIIDLGYSRVIVTAPACIHEIIPGCIPPALPYLAGFSVAVTDLNIVRKLLQDNRVSYLEYDGRLIVPSAEACGSAVLFESEGSTRI